MKMRWGVRRTLLTAALVIAAWLMGGCASETEVGQTVVPCGNFIGLKGESYVLTPDQMIEDILDRIHLSLPMANPATLDPVLASFFSGIVTDNVTVTGIEYMTISPTGDSVRASGVIAYTGNVASDGIYDRIVSVQHGTCDIDKAPSLMRFPVEIVPVFQKGSRNVVVMADYLGYGSNRTADLQHPYVHALYTGTACADMLKAAETYLARYSGLQSDGKVPVALCGYSQGGQATMATLFELQKRGYVNRIDDVRAGAGPYDLLAVFERFKSQYGKEYSRCGYIPYTIRGLVYGDQLDVDMHNLLSPALFEPDHTGKSLYDRFGTTMLSTWHEPLGTDVAGVLHPDFVKPEGQQNADVRKFLAATASNSLVSYDTPMRPETVTLFHETDDEQVPYSCSVNASREWGCRLENLEIASNVHFLGAIEFFLRYLDDGIWVSASELLSLIRQFL